MSVDAPLYPVGLVVQGRPCLVVGGGRVAARKAAGLVECGADVHVIATAVSEAVRTLGVTWEERAYRTGDVVGYRLVLAATDDADVNAAIHRDADAQGIWVNSADDPANCTFTLPSVIRRGSVTVAVATGGRAPALAAWLRRRLEQEVGPEYATLADLLAEARDEMHRSGASTEAADWQKALDSAMLGLIREGRITEARELLRACLSSSSA